LRLVARAHARLRAAACPTSTSTDEDCSGTQGTLAEWHDPGISVVYYSNRCSLLLTAFCCILVHFDAFSEISLHSILLHS
ncbi:hypothetical protein, partial [Klebsiella pneumoniae]|uniref:hypothetical protein n=1 Tax=Klebsiella pneumoniae TaxID=573 RepID=UPI0025A0AE51